MSQARARAVWLCAALCWSGTALAQSRPSEADLFGSAPAQEKPAEPAPATTRPEQDEAGELTLPASSLQHFGNDTGTADPITIGGQMYLRAQSTALAHQQIEDFTLSVPNLLDLYIDARPNERLRGFVLGRLSYDPMLPDKGGVPSVGTSATDDGTAGSASLSSLLGSPTNEPHVLLDQLWLRFDMWHWLFVTVGRQHVRWGTARFWTPADFLHPQRKNPLDVFDARPGNDMLKLHLPIESTSWNFYAYAIAGGYNDTPTLYSVSGAARAEFVADSNELGIGALVRRGVRPRYEADLSMALGPFDLYAEAALIDAGEIDRVGYAPNAELPDPDSMAETMAGKVLDRIQQAIDTYYPVYRDSGYKPQVVAGLNFTQSYNDNDSFTFGLEYFYNGLGYSDPNIYPGLLFPHSRPLQNPAPFFYLGKHYAAAFLFFPSPFSLDLHSFTLSTLCNISDRSCTSRFDYALQALTHMRFEVYVAYIFGHKNGEFPFGIETPPIDGVSLGRQPAVVNMGLALRIAI